MAISFDSNQPRNFFASRVTVENGRAFTQNKSIDVPLALPIEVGGEPSTDPKSNAMELIGGGVAACFAAELQFRANALGLNPTNISVIGTGVIKSDTEDGYGKKMEIDLAVSLAGLSRDQAMALIQAAEAECPACTELTNCCRVHLDSVTPGSS